MINLKSKIYIAGHKGLIGSAILRKLQSDGYKRIPGSCFLYPVWRGLDAELLVEPPRPAVRPLETPLTKLDAAPAAAFFAMFTKLSLIPMSKYPYTLY